MRIDDLVLVSIDDHIIEPADMFERHMPAKLRDRAPVMRRLPDGVDRWEFAGTETGPTGLGAVASWPKEEWGFDPVGHAEMRPGCYDVHERVRDMNANGVAVSMCFPTMAGFAGTYLANIGDRELAAAVASAYNDWHIDEWAGAYPGRFLPLAIGPLWDVDALVAEMRRVSAKGCNAITFPETPYGLGLPSFYTDHWDPVFAAACDLDMAICMHIGGAFNLVQAPKEAPVDHIIIMAPQLSAFATTDLMASGTFRKFPTLKIALSEGGIGWIPFYLDRVDRHVDNQSWTGLDVSGQAKLPTDVFRSNFVGCFITDPSALRLRDRIGVDTITWECDYPHSDSTWPRSPEYLLRELEAAACTDEEIEKITWKNASRFFGFDPFALRPREQVSVGALRALATDVDTSTTSKAEYRRRYEARVATTA